MGVIKSRNSMCEVLHNVSLSQCQALRLVDSKGDKKTRLVWDGVEDQKLRIRAQERFCMITHFFDRLMAKAFNKLGYERKWVQIHIDQKGKTKRILLNIDSLAKRTLLTRSQILKMSNKELVQTLSRPEEIRVTEKKLKDFFPHASMISMKKDKDRVEGVRDHLDGIGAGDFQFDVVKGVPGKALPAKWLGKMSKSDDAKRRNRDDRAGRLGCYLAHLNALKKARQMGRPHVLILEDDVRFLTNAQNTAYIEKAMKELPDDWGMLFIGYSDYDSKKKEKYSEHLARPGYPLGLFAYVVHSRFYDQLIDILETELKKENGEVRAVDVVVADDVPQTRQLYALRDNLAVVASGFSNTVGEDTGGHVLHPAFRRYERQVIPSGTISAKEASTRDNLPVMDPLIAGALYQMMQGVDKVFEQYGIRYWVDSGTLLGAERHKGMIPWDDDIDLCIYPGDEEKMKNPEVIKALKDVGLDIADHWLGAKVFASADHPKGALHKFDGYEYRAPAIDLFFTKEDTDKDGEPGYSYKTERAARIWPESFYRKECLFGNGNSFKRVKFGPVFVNGLVDPKPVLYRLYGNDCLREATQQYDHVKERGIKKRYVEMKDFRAPHYVEWDKLPALQPVKEDDSFSLDGIFG